MAEIHLNDGQVAIVDDEDLEWLSKFSWRAIRRRNNFAVAVSDVLMSRLILGLDTNDSLKADHINRNPMDNRRQNLRKATARQNSLNRSPRPGKFKGVCASSQGWSAHIRVHGKAIRLGTFLDPRDAARAYDKAAKHHFGEFAAYNFPDESHE